jgi:hypothetical protein
LIDSESDALRTAGFGKDEAALMERHATAQIRQRESTFAISAIGGADELKQRLVLRNRQQLAFAEHPAGGREVAGKHADLANVRLCHGCLLQVGEGKMPCRAMQKLSARNGCMLR